MKLILYLVGRLIVIGFALCLALIAGSLFIGYGLASGLFPELLASNGTSVFGDREADRSILAVLTFALGMIASVQLAGVAVLPVTLAIAFSELMQWRSLAVQLILGGVCALYVMFTVLGMQSGQTPSNGTVIVSLATGFVAAFFYWVVAGRNAGEWLSALGK